MKVLSVNVASKTNLNVGERVVETGIFKKPCDGPVFVSKLGIVGDVIVNTEVHGGEDQAVYMYSMADYQWWSEQLGRVLIPGTFGENLTLSAFPNQALRVGDRLKINNALHLEITAPRVPCVKLATKMGDPAFGKKFVAAVRPGAYARVLTEAEIKRGDDVVWDQPAADSVSINDFFIEWHKKDWSPDFFQRVLQAPISKIARGIVERRLAAP